ncbi:hypothetical protein B0H66DRAFT_177435 [Apodospora peruviana]|uniref:Uncharacterized protein n=1 Tax=Apodospora peruviana TaxID=516989 RepID=A0AAE0IBH1_9PEZI|nr:hypothetical protein B0H66DRAFT_177435 [Apodospora peruviana]
MRAKQMWWVVSSALIQAAITTARRRIRGRCSGEREDAFYNTLRILYSGSIAHLLVRFWAPLLDATIHSSQAGTRAADKSWHLLSGAPSMDNRARSFHPSSLASS